MSADYKFIEDRLNKGKKMGVNQLVFRCEKGRITRNYLMDEKRYVEVKEEEGGRMGKCGNQKDYRRTYCCRECYRESWMEEGEEEEKRQGEGGGGGR